MEEELAKGAPSHVQLGVLHSEKEEVVVEEVEWVAGWQMQTWT